MTATQTTSTLKDQALAAFEDSINARAAQRAKEDAAQVLLIHRALAELGIEAADEAYMNLASRRSCVPLIVGAITTEGCDGDEGLVFTHTVAAEWSDDADDPGLVLVADLEPGDGHTDRWLYPAGKLNGLADIGAALEHGGRSGSSARKTGAAERIDYILSRACVDSDDAGVVLTGFEAVCTALLDIAAAIRETAGA